jgi:hypothetical protein
MVGQPYIPDQTNHLLHLILSLLTFGLWTPIWIIVGWSNSRTRETPIRRAQGIPD